MSMTVAELLVRDAVDRGVPYLFGIPDSGPALALVEAIRTSDAKLVLVNNEASAAMAAGAYGDMTGQAPISFSIPGPGAANLVGGVVNCFLDRMPTMALTSYRPDELAHTTIVQGVDQKAMFAPIVKASYTLRPETARETVAHAAALAAAPRRGPVHVDLPRPSAAAEVAHWHPTPAGAASPQGIAGNVIDARNRIARAGRIVLITGTDALDAGAGPQIRALAESCRAAVLGSPRSRGMFPEDHPRHAGTLVGVFADSSWETSFLREADLVILAGVDPIELHAPWPDDLPAMRLQGDPELDEPAPKSECKLFGPLSELLAQLAGASPKTGFSEDDIAEIKTAAREKFAPSSDAPLSSEKIFDMTRRLLPERNVMVLESNITNVLAEYIWPVTQTGTYITCGGSRTIGSVVPLAIGVRLARPQGSVVAFCGDGGFMMRIQELEVVARLGLRCVFVVINDGHFGTIRAQQGMQGYTPFGLSLGPVDFPHVAEAFGLRGVAVETPGEYERALGNALSAEKSTVIDVHVDKHAHWQEFATLLGKPLEDHMSETS